MDRVEDGFDKLDSECMLEEMRKRRKLERPRAFKLFKEGPVVSILEWDFLVKCG